MKSQKEIVDYICKPYTRKRKKELLPEINKNVEFLMTDLRSSENVLAAWYGFYKGGVSSSDNDKYQFNMVYILTNKRIFWGKDESTKIIRSYSLANLEGLDMKFEKGYEIIIEIKEDHYTTSLEAKELLDFINFAGEICNTALDLIDKFLDANTPVPSSKLTKKQKEEAGKKMIAATMELKLQQEAKIKAREKKRQEYLQPDKIDITDGGTSEGMRTAKEITDYIVKKHYADASRNNILKNSNVLESNLMKNEEVLIAWMGQYRSGAGGTISSGGTIGKMIFAITNKRIIWAKKELFGSVIKSVMIDKLNDVTLRKGLATNYLSFDSITEGFTSLVAIRQSTMQELYNNIMEVLESIRK